jgi:predicted GNAT family N-acyltransferase
MKGIMTSSRREFSVRRADWSRDADALRSVRTRVFVDEQAVPEALEWDGADERAVHLLAVDAESRPIGTTRLLASGQIGRMAVLPAWRRRGVGSALLRETLLAARKTGLPPPFLNAQTSALSFYARMGFVPVGAQFAEAGIPHRRMVFREQES